MAGYDWVNDWILTNFQEQFFWVQYKNICPSWQYWTSLAVLCVLSRYLPALTKVLFPHRTSAAYLLSSHHISHSIPSFSRWYIMVLRSIRAVVMIKKWPRLLILAILEPRGRMHTLIMTIKMNTALVIKQFIVTHWGIHLLEQQQCNQKYVSCCISIINLSLRFST